LGIGINESSTYVRWEARGKLLELPQVGSNVDVSIFRAAVLVQKHAQQRLSSASILNGLRREPHILLALCFYSGKVEFAIQRFVLLRLLAGGVFEEEDDTDGVELLEGLWV
jgi:hypothetical protein